MVGVGGGRAGNEGGRRPETDGAVVSAGGEMLSLYMANFVARVKMFACSKGVCVRERVRVSVSVSEREKEGEREKVCVCMYVYDVYFHVYGVCVCVWCMCMG